MDAEAERQLLEEGAKSYVAAEDAVRAFRELVHSRCKDVVEKRLPDYCTALGKQILKNSITEQNWSEGANRELGANIDLGGYDELGHVLCLSQDDREPPSVCTYIYMWRRKKFSRVRSVLCRLEPSLDFDSNAIWLAEEISRAKIGEFEDALDGLLVRWIKLWKKTGGLKILGLGSADSED